MVAIVVPDPLSWSTLSVLLAPHTSSCVVVMALFLVFILLLAVRFVFVLFLRRFGRSLPWSCVSLVFGDFSTYSLLYFQGTWAGCSAYRELLWADSLLASAPLCYFRCKWWLASPYVLFYSIVVLYMCKLLQNVIFPVTSDRLPYWGPWILIIDFTSMGL